MQFDRKEKYDLKKRWQRREARDQWWTDNSITLGLLLFAWMLVLAHVLIKQEIDRTHRAREIAQAIENQARRCNGTDCWRMIENSTLKCNFCSFKSYGKAKQKETFI